MKYLLLLLLCTGCQSYIRIKIVSQPGSGPVEVILDVTTHKPVQVKTDASIPASLIP